MDPDACLKELLELVESVEAVYADADDMTQDELVAVAFDARRMAELVKALHGWLSQGGFKPSCW